MPESEFQITRPHETHKQFMEFTTKGKNDEKFRDIVQDGLVSPERMKQVLKTAADKVVTKPNYQVTLDNGVEVRVTRRDKLPYTLVLKPMSGKYRQTVDVDLVPAMKVSNSKLPAATQTRLQEVQNKVGSNVDEFLAIAMPIVHKDKFEVDFPNVSREILKDRPSAKMAIRLLKQERNEKGGPMEKIWSHAIKVAAIHEVLKNPDKDHWHEARLPLRFQEIRNAMQRYLSNEKMTDPFYPEVNMMERIKSTNVKQGVAKYLDRSARGAGDAKDIACPSAQCNRMFKTEGAARQHAADAHGSPAAGSRRPLVRLMKLRKDIACPSAQCNRMFKTEDGARQHAADAHAHGSPAAGSRRQERDTECALGMCEKLLRGKFGAVMHAVDSHRAEADEKNVWKNFLRDIGKIPCDFCNCGGGRVRGFGSQSAYNDHARAMNH